MLKTAMHSYPLLKARIIMYKGNKYPQKTIELSAIKSLQRWYRARVKQGFRVVDRAVWIKIGNAIEMRSCLNVSQLWRAIMKGRYEEQQEVID